MIMSHTISSQETINEQGEEIRILMKENVKPQIVFIEVLKKMVTKLELISK